MAKEIIQLIEYAYVKSLTLTKQYNGEDCQWELVLELNYEAQDENKQTLRTGNKMETVVFKEEPITDADVLNFMQSGLAGKIALLKQEVAGYG
jgi:hypothetical protein